MPGCLACDLSAGRQPLPGGLIYRTKHWNVEHALGPLGPGTLIVKPARHVTNVGDLNDDEAAELGPLLRDTTAIARRLVDADQVYNCLWSHADRQPGHIHYVIQPVTRAHVTEHDAHGPYLQAAMFTARRSTDLATVEQLAKQARDAFAVART